MWSFAAQFRLPSLQVFVEFSSTFESYAAVANDVVDVVAGSRVTVEADYRERTTGRGFSFSSPYFYDTKDSNSSTALWDAYGMMTNENDSQWSDFVYWVVMATILAEELEITQSSSGQMPVVSLFGESLKQMLRDCVLAVGSYGELYNRTLLIPRAGANLLNKDLSGPQQFPFPLG